MNRKQPAVAPQSVGLDPLTIALAGVLLLAAFCSWRIHTAAGSVIDLATDPDTYATMVVEHHDNTRDVQSDNVRLEVEVSQGRRRLMNAQAEAVVMLLVCGAIGVALGVRCWRQGRG